MNKIFYFLVLLGVAFVALLAGAKYHGDVIENYRQVAKMLGIGEGKQNEALSKQEMRQQFLDRFNNERPHSHLDEITRLDINEHQQYLNQLQEKYKNNIPLPKMIDIPAGSYEMGCRREGCPIFEQPVRKVTIAPFQIAATELTFEQWDFCVADGGCDILPHDFGWGRADRPVVNISWDDAQRYIKWLNSKTKGGYRLPSEAEWEYAARAGQYEHDYPWQENQYPSCDPESPYAARFGVAAHFKNQDSECDYYGTSPVASFKPNAWGLYDVLGNAAEYTQDCAGGYDLSQVPADGSAYTDSLCFRRMLRGGAWTTSGRNVNVTMRRHYYRWQTYDRSGFRLARDIKSARQ